MNETPEQKREEQTGDVPVEKKAVDEFESVLFIFNLARKNL